MSYRRGIDRLAFVNKHGIGKSMHVIRELSRKEYGLIRAIVSGDLKLKSKKAQGFLQKVHAKDQWIGCRCRKGQTPLMSVRHQKNGTYAIIRLTQRARHARHCFFYSEKFYSGKTGGNTPRKGGATRVQNVCFHRAPLEKEESELESNEEEATPLRGIPTMARALFTLMEQGGVSTFDGEEKVLKSQFRAMGNAARDIRMAGRLQLSTCLYFNPWEIGKAAVRLKQNWNRWPQWSRPHAVFIFRCGEATGTSVSVHGGEKTQVIRLHKRILIPEREMGGPYVVLLTVAGAEDKPTWLRPMKGFGVPVLRKDALVPVESHGERELGHLLHSWMQEKRRNVTAEKLLFHIETPLGSCRPSFRLQREGREVFLHCLDVRRHDAREDERIHGLPNRVLVSIDADAPVGEKISWRERRRVFLRTRFLLQPSA
jgi:hypothetical protein